MSFNALSLDKWLSLLENRHSNIIQMGLERIRVVGKAMGLLQPKAPVVTVAGTNGKGSTVTAVETIYRAQGYKTGSHISPHLYKFNERICINGQPVSDDLICLAFTEIESAREEVSLTYFETITLAALYIFSKSEVDIIILEVGLGGRLDATNVIDANVAVITTIDFDHQAWLGNTLDEIGYEKAGIARPGCPLIYADNLPPGSVVDHAKKIGATLVQFGRDYDVYKDGEVWSFCYNNHPPIIFSNIKLHIKAIAAALAVVQLLQPRLPVAYKTYQSAIGKMFLHGRHQWLSINNHTVLLDVAHNPQSSRLLADNLLQARSKYGAVHCVFSALADKDGANILLPMKDLIDTWHVAPLTTSRGAKHGLLSRWFDSIYIHDRICYNDVFKAYCGACQQAKPQDLIVVYGSFYTVAEAMEGREEEFTL